MIDYKVGYCKPPREHQFKKGVCANPKGRGKRESFSVGAVTRAVLDELVKVTEAGKTTQMRRFDLLIRKCVAAAVRGDVRCAELLLDIRDHAKRYRVDETHVIRITGGLPD